jgi:hypothetical protein
MTFEWTGGALRLHLGTATFDLRGTSECVRQRERLRGSTARTRADYAALRRLLLRGGIEHVDLVETEHDRAPALFREAHDAKVLIRESPFDVLPDRPLRQWVVTVPFELRMVLATRADAMREVLKIIAKEIERVYTRRALGRGVVKARFGGITFIHRFGGSLNLHVHFHVVVIDGVYDETAREFSSAEPPDAITLRTFLERVHARVWKWARRRAERYASERARDANGFEALGIQRGLFAALDERGRPVDRDDDDAFDPKRMPGHADRYEGFSVHAGVTVAADDRAGREASLPIRGATAVQSRASVGAPRWAHRVSHEVSPGRMATRTA